MNRRNFLTRMRKFSMVAAVSGVTAGTVANIQSATAGTRNDVAGQLDKLKRRMDSLESGQKRLVKAFCIVTAVSTGLDLTLLV